MAGLIRISLTLCAVALADSRWRAGFALSREPREIGPEEITRPQLDQLLADPFVSVFVKRSDTGEGMSLDHLSAESVESIWTQFQSGAGAEASGGGGAPPPPDAEAKDGGIETPPPSADPGAGDSTAAVEAQESRSGTDGGETLQSAPAGGEKQPAESPSLPVAAADNDKPAGRKAKPA